MPPFQRQLPNDESRIDPAPESSVRSGHAAAIEAFMDRIPADLPVDQLALLFEQRLNTLWRRTESILGDVTVAAVLSRVLHEVARSVPLVNSLQLQPKAGVQFGALTPTLRPDHAPQLREGMRRILLGFITVLGNLTADILSPALYEVLEQEFNGAAGKMPGGSQHEQEAGA